MLTRRRLMAMRLLGGEVTPPVAPSGLTATARGGYQIIDLAWTDNADNEDGFGIERSTDGSTYAELTTVAADTVSYEDTGLTPGQQYYYRVRAYIGSAYSDYTEAANETVWSPSSLSPAAWWRADLGLYTDTAGTTPATADAALVALWQDQTANNNDITQATEGLRPALKTNIVNGQQVVRFDGSDDVLSAADNGTLDLAAPCEVWACLNKTAGGANMALLNKASAYRFGAYTDDIYVSLYGHTDLRSDVDWFARAGGWGVVGYIYDADYDLNIYLNGYDRLDEVAYTEDIIASDEAVSVGGRIGSQYMPCDLLDLLVFNVALSDPNRMLLSQYAAGRAGVFIYPYNVNAATAAHAATYLTTPTPDESGQGMHPSVLDMAIELGAGQVWNGYRYWMAMSPLTGGNAGVEDPCILASEDGDTWVVPVGLTNPIDNESLPGYFSDPELVLSPDGLTLYCIYRWCDGAGTVDKLYSQQSTNGVTWANKTEILSDAFQALKSPTVVYDGTQYVMWVQGSPIQRRTSAAVTSGWSDPADCTVETDEGTELSLGHIGAFYDATSGMYYMVADYDGLRFLASPDGVTWWLQKTRMIGDGGGGVWDEFLYRATMAKDGDTFELWYSAYTNDTGDAVWHTGRTTITF